MDLQVILDRLDGVRHSGGRYRARCPVHLSRGLTLSVSEGDNGKPVVHCFAGCEPAAILGAIGLTWSDFYPKASQSEDQPRPVEFPADVRRVAEELWQQAKRYGIPFSELVNARFEDPLPEEAYGGWAWTRNGTELRCHVNLPPSAVARERTRRQVLAVKLGFPPAVASLAKTALEEGWTYPHIYRRTPHLSREKQAELVAEVVAARAGGDAR